MYKKGKTIRINTVLHIMFWVYCNVNWILEMTFHMAIWVLYSIYTAKTGMHYNTTARNCSIQSFFLQCNDWVPYSANIVFKFMNLHEQFVKVHEYDITLSIVIMKQLVNHTVITTPTQEAVHELMNNDLLTSRNLLMYWVKIMSWSEVICNEHRQSVHQPLQTLGKAEITFCKASYLCTTLQYITMQCSIY